MASTVRAERPTLRPSNRYLFDWIRARERPGGRVLDFGCGDGALVFAARDAGVDVYGAETFYEGARPEDVERVRARDPDGTLIRTIRDGLIDFPDEFFDLMVANQVFEHVEDLPQAAREIHRVLKPGGSLLSLFPVRSVVREAHLGVPFIHRLPRGRFRRVYGRASQRLGVGFKEHLWGTGEAALDKAFGFLDTQVYYRSAREVRAVFEPLFRVRFVEEEYLAHRVASRMPVSRAPGVRQAARAFTRLAAGAVLEATK